MCQNQSGEIFFLSGDTLSREKERVNIMFAEGYTKPERENDWLHIPEKGKEKLGQPVIFFKQTRMAQLHKKYT